MVDEGDEGVYMGIMRRLGLMDAEEVGLWL